MNGRRWVLAAAVSGLLAGCDEPKQSTGAGPATQPSQTHQVVSVPDLDRVNEAAKVSPTTKPAPLPEISTLAANETGVPGAEVLYEFPRTRLHINREEKTATIYSDDPKAGIDTAYSGNSYYLVVPLERDDVSDLNGYEWHFRAGGSQHQEATDGVFRGGQRFHYQPSDMIVAFRGSGAKIEVAVIGMFMRFDTQQTPEVGVPVKLNGILTATVDNAK